MMRRVVPYLRFAACRQTSCIPNVVYQGHALRDQLVPHLHCGGSFPLPTYRLRKLFTKGPVLGEPLCGPDA